MIYGKLHVVCILGPMCFCATEMQYDINRRLAEWRLREQAEAERAKKEKAEENSRMNRELQRLRKEDHRSKLVEEETKRRAEKGARRGARAEENRQTGQRKKKADKRAAHTKKLRGRSVERFSSCQMTNLYELIARLQKCQRTPYSV